MARYIKADKLYPTNFEIFMCEGDYEKALELMLEKIDNAPAEDVAPVAHAHWKDGCCTNCRTPKFVIKVVRGFDEVVYEYGGEANYCPNCGAKMDERSE